MPYVGDAKRKYQREWQARRRAEYMAGAKCARCPATTGLELDHVDPAQKTSHKIWSWARPRLEAELAKCQWLCVACHRRKSLADAGQTFQHEAPHGSRARYESGCRCEPCRASERNRKARYREQRALTAPAARPALYKLNPPTR